MAEPASAPVVEPPQQEPLPSIPSPSKAGPPPAQRRNEASDSKVLKLKGLPYSTSEAEILEFFSNYNVTEIAFVYEPDGRPSGLAFAEFATREEALQALSKNGEYLGDRYVRLLHVPKQEMEEQVRLGTLAIPGAQAKMRQRMMRGGGGGHGGLDGPGGYGGDALQQVHAGMLQGGQQVVPDLPGGGGYPPHGLPGLGMPHSMAQPGMHHPLGGMGLAPMGHAGGMAGPGGMMPGGMVGHGGMPGVGDGPGMQLPVGGGQQGIPGGMGGMPPHMALAYQLSGMNLSSGQPRPGGGHMGGMVHQMMGGHGYGGGGGGAQAPPMAVIGTDSKTIKIRGLPFRATPLDIFNFFDSYEVIAESLQLGVDALGRPSGEAWLTFGSSEEALRAVRERNRHYLGNRYLELSLT